MNALKRKNPLTESFLVQLDVDLEGLGMRHPKYKSAFAYSEDNLGVSRAKAPIIGPKDHLFPPGRQNECNFMRISEDVPVALDPQGQSNTQDSTNDFRQDSNQANWMPMNDRTADRGQDVQRTLQGLALGNIPTNPFPQGNSYMQTESSNGGEPGLSPDTGHSTSNRPTPNSTTPSDTRSNLQAPNKSSGTSYETSPASSHQDGRSMNAFFNPQTDYNNIQGTGLTPDATFTMPETPGRDFQVPAGWEMSGQTTGLTPVGDGVFRHLMGLGSLDPMDIGWEGGA